MSELFPGSKNAIRKDLEPSGGIWRPLLIAAGVVALLVAIAYVPTRAEEAAPTSSASLTDVDSLLEGGDADAALAQLRARLDASPNDAQLHWRAGRALVLQNRKLPALVAYRDALRNDPKLLDDETFAQQLDALLQEPTLRPEAIDLSIRELGTHGHAFLLARVNDGKDPLAYADRMRVLTHLRADPQAAEGIDVALALALDLRQAFDSPAPCRTFADALARLETDPTQRNPELLAGVRPPTGDAAECTDLAQRFAALGR